MYTLGLNAYHGDSSACIFQHNELLVATEEERIRRIKHWAGLPTEAVKFCLEEAGITLNASDGKMVSSRRMQRPHDIRIARKDMPQYGINEGGVFTVSTQAVFFYIPDLKQKNLTAGDDAASVRLMALKDITPDTVGIVDHEAMLKEALAENASVLRAQGIRPETMKVGSVHAQPNGKA